MQQPFLNQNPGPKIRNLYTVQYTPYLEKLSYSYTDRHEMFSSRLQSYPQGIHFYHNNTSIDLCYSYDINVGLQ
jgi:hypothetical protein